MKRLFLIGGTMGVGKTSVSQLLKEKLDNAVFLDGDWCWNPDIKMINDETKGTVLKNICYLLNSYIKCDTYENIIFCWVMHEQVIIKSILEGIDTSKCDIKVISLLAIEETLRKRIMKDVESGLPSIDVLERSLKRIPMYNSVDSIKINTDGKTINEIADEIIEI